MPRVRFTVLWVLLCVCYCVSEIYGAVDEGGDHLSLLLERHYLALANSPPSKSDIPSIVAAIKILGKLGSLQSRNKAFLCATLEQELAEFPSLLTLRRYATALEAASQLGCLPKDLKHEGLDQILSGVQTPETVYFWLSAAFILKHPSFPNMKQKWYDYIESNATETLQQKLYILHLTSLYGSHPRVEVSALLKQVEIEAKDSLVTFHYLTVLSSLKQLNHLDIKVLRDLYSMTVATLFDMDITKSSSALVAVHAVLTNQEFLSPILQAQRFVASSNAEIVIKATHPITGISLVADLSVTLSAVTCDQESVESGNITLKEAGSYVIARNSLPSDAHVCLFEFSIQGKAHQVQVFEPLKSITVVLGTSLSVENIEISAVGSHDTDDKSFRFVSIDFGDDISPLIHGNLKRLLLSFFLFDAVTNSYTTAHQVFLNFIHQETGYTATFIAEHDSSKRYNCSIVVSSVAASSFGFLSGTYQAELLVGDFALSSPLTWSMGRFDLTFSKNTTIIFPSDHHVRLPELTNTPKPLPKQPNIIISLFFTALVLSLASSCFYLWFLMGFRLQIRISFWRIVFYASFLGQFATLYCYWSFLNGFQAIKIYAPLSALTLLSLNYILDARIIV